MKTSTRLCECPHCGGKLDLGDSDIPFTPQQREIFDILHRNLGRYVMTGDIVNWLYQLRDEPKDPEQVVINQIKNMRKHVTILSAWGRGYCLPPNYRN